MTNPTRSTESLLQDPERLVAVAHLSEIHQRIYGKVPARCWVRSLSNEEIIAVADRLAEEETKQCGLYGTSAN